MNIDCLGAGVSICPQLSGEYALTSNLGHCGEYWVFLLLHELIMINVKTIQILFCFLVKISFSIHPLVHHHGNLLKT